MNESEIPKKIIKLTTICTEYTQNVVTYKGRQSEPFYIRIILKQGDTLSSLLFDLVIRTGNQKVKKRQTDEQGKILGCAYNIDLGGGGTFQEVINSCIHLRDVTLNVGLSISLDKTDYMRITIAEAECSRLHIC